MAQTVAFAWARLCIMTYIPMMSALVLSKKIKHQKNFSDRMMERVERGYQFMLQKVLNFSRVIVAATIVLFAVAVLV